jgi:glutamine---fructose-6-phosphate transaminase (isomerizing)
MTHLERGCLLAGECVVSVEHPVLANIMSLADNAIWQRSEALADAVLPGWSRNLASRGVSRVYFVGCATSYHAGLAGKYAVERLAHIPAEAMLAFPFSVYLPTELLGPQTLVVGISKTGGTEAVCMALAKARNSGAPTLAVTATSDSQVTRLADAAVLTGGHDDKVECKTSSYALSLVTVILLALYLARATGKANAASDQYWRRQLRVAESSAASCLSLQSAQQSATAQLARRYASASRVFCLGSGPNQATAEEGALKVVEMAKVPAEAQDFENFMHGRFHELDALSPLLVVAPSGAAGSRLLDFLTATTHAGASTIVLTDRTDRSLQSLATHVIPMPGSFDELVSPLVHIVPLYLFGYYLAMEHKVDPGAGYDVVPYRLRYSQSSSSM